MTRSVGGRPRTDHFVLLVDPSGSQYVACDRRGCSWIRPVVANSTLHRIERLTIRHTHAEGWT